MNSWKSTSQSSTITVQKVQATNDQTASNNAYLSWIAKKQSQPLENKAGKSSVDYWSTISFINSLQLVEGFYQFERY